MLHSLFIGVPPPLGVGPALCATASIRPPSAIGASARQPEISNQPPAGPPANIQTRVPVY